MNEAGALHVVPHDDLIEHEACHTCICGPRLKMMVDETGFHGWAFIHHSLDGREIDDH